LTPSIYPSNQKAGIAHSDWLRTGLPRGRSSSPYVDKNFHFSMSSSPALGPTQLLIQFVQGAFYSGVKRLGREADHSPSTSAEVSGVVLN
jgi:hypothetical protein